MDSIQDRFYQRLSALPCDPCRVVELGTRAWDGHGERHHRHLVLAARHNAEWTGVDILAGEGVDVVADVHALSNHFPPKRFDAAVMVAILEHLARPWVVATELAKVVRPGGIVLCGTHQTFPYHAYPADYFRFTTEGLGEIFSTDAGWKILEVTYEHPCKVIPLENLWTHANDWNFLAESWLCVSCIAERI